MIGKPKEEVEDYTHVSRAQAVTTVLNVFLWHSLTFVSSYFSQQMYIENIQDSLRSRFRR